MTSYYFWLGEEAEKYHWIDDTVNKLMAANKADPSFIWGLVLQGKL